MKDWPDAKRFLVESIIVYIAILFFSLTWDCFKNLFIFAGLHEGAAHPYEIGLFQALGTLFSTGQLIRYWNFWRYWK